MSPALPEVLWLYHFDENGVGVAAPPDIAHLKRSSARWSWLHLPLSDARCRAFVQHVAALPEEGRALILGPEQGPRLFLENGWMFGVLSDVERNLAGEPTSTAGRLRFATDGEILITLRRHSLFAIDQVRREIDKGHALATPLDAIEAVTEHYCEAVSQQLRNLAAKLDRVEDRVLEESLGGPPLGPVRRDLLLRHRELSAMRVALQHAARGKATPPATVETLQRIAANLDDVDREASAQQDRGRLLHDELDTLVSAATNRSLRALTIVSTVLLPPTVIVGAFGMNLKGIPYGDSSVGFAIACLWCLGSVAAALFVLWRLRVFD